MANEKLGHGLNMVRVREGLTQKDLAKKIKKTQAYVNQMESGNISFQKFNSILNTMGYTFSLNIEKIKEVEEIHI